MRILHFCMNAPFTEKYSYQDNLLTEYQHKLGHEVRIITTTRTRGESGAIIHTKMGFKILDNGVELIRLKAPGKLRGLFGLYTGLYEQIVDYQPNLIFIHGLCSFIPSAAVKYKHRCDNSVHIVADNHQDTGTTKVIGFPFSLVMQIHRTRWKKWIKDVDKVYGTTSWRKTFAHDCYGIPDEKLDVLIMGVDFDRIPQKRDVWKNKVREELHIDEKQFVFVTGGKLDNRKKTMETLKAFHSLCDENIRFLIFGSVGNDIAEEFRKMVDGDERIIFLGYIPSQDIWRYFYAADFGLFPGRHSVLWEEAIGCGLPCLFHRYEEKDHTDVCGNCICITDSDTQTIYNVLLSILNNKDNFDSLKKKAEKASFAFSYYHIAEKSLK